MSDIKQSQNQNQQNLRQNLRQSLCQDAQPAVRQPMPKHAPFVRRAAPILTLAIGFRGNMRFRRLMRRMIRLSRRFGPVIWHQYKMRVTASSLPALLVKQALVFSVNSGWTEACQAVISVISDVWRGSYLELSNAVWSALDCQSGPLRGRKDARVAQLVEQRTENPRVGGSSPPPGTTFLVSHYLSHCL